MITTLLTRLLDLPAVWRMFIRIIRADRRDLGTVLPVTQFDGLFTGVERVADRPAVLATRHHIMRVRHFRDVIAMCALAHTAHVTHTVTSDCVSGCETR